MRKQYLDYAGLKRVLKHLCGKAENIVIKAYNVDCNLLDYGQQPTNAAPFSPTGVFKSNLKVDTTKVAVVVRHLCCLNSDGSYSEPFVSYNIGTFLDGNLTFSLLNISNETKKCVKCRVWFWLIGKPEDMPN